MSNGKLVFVKKSGADKKTERLKSNIQYAPGTNQSFDAERLSMLTHDEMGQWQEPSEYMKQMETGLKDKIIKGRKNFDCSIIGKDDTGTVGVLPVVYNAAL